MRTFEYIDHTGDLGIRVRGKTLQDLFTNAAHALFETVAVLDTIDPISQFQIDVKAESVAELMVAWLDELIFRHEVDEVFFKRVEIVELSRRAYLHVPTENPWILPSMLYTRRLRV